ncbi:MAG: hypothetical protein FJ299_14155 [Planctomycetes bacterium]|nr:hypothetical protein [Planctomycetota bacterium]
MHAPQALPRKHPRAVRRVLEGAAALLCVALLNGASCQASTCWCSGDPCDPDCHCGDDCGQQALVEPEAEPARLVITVYAFEVPQGAQR